MSIASVSDFTNEIAIAQRSDPATAEIINADIATYENEYLKLILGTDLYSLFIAGIAGLYTDPTTAILPKWQALLDKVKPPMLSYIYWHYRQTNSSQTTGTGETTPLNENSTNVAPAKKMARQWDKMVDENYEIINFINANETDYGKYYRPSLIAWIGAQLYGFGRCVGNTKYEDMFHKQIGNAFGI